MAVFTLANPDGTSTLNTENLNLSFLFSFTVNRADPNTIFLSGFGNVFLTGEDLTIRKTPTGTLADVTGGTLDAMTITLGASTALTIGGLDLNARRFFDLIQAEADRKAASMMFSGADVFVLGAGDDQVFSRAGDDIIFAGEGNDTLSGGTGRDTIVGGDGNDSFIFSAKPLAGNADFTDAFFSGTDILFFDNDAFPRLGPLGALSASRLAFGTAATDANDRLIYNGSNGKLWYDPDGTGAKAKILVATVASGFPLDTTSIFIID